MHSRLAIASLLALLLVVGLIGGYALGSIPSSDGFIHACYQETPSRFKPVVLLDKDQGGCTGAYPNEVKLVGTAGP